MPETVNGTAEGGQAGITPEQDSGGGDDLVTRLTTSANLERQFEGQDQGRETEQAATTEQAQPSGLTEASVDALLSKALGPIREQLAAAKMENANLRGMVAIATREKPAPAPIVVPAAAPKLTDDQLVEQLRTKPLETLRAMIGEAVEATEKRVRDELGGQVAQVGQTAAATRHQAALKQEADTVNREYPMIRKDSPEFNAEFYADMESEWTALTQDAGNPYALGLLQQAAERAERKWFRAGKNPFAKTNGPAGARPTEIRQVNRTTMQVNGSAGGGQRNGKPTSIAELNLSAEEQAAAREIVRRSAAGGQKFSEADFVRNYLAAQEEIPNFGQ